jgi:UDP-N-acetylmuramoylalanine--D-glutamate ligase
MTPVGTFAGRRVALFGLGGSGVATLRALLAGGAEVAAWDDNEAQRAKVLAQGFALADLAAADWSAFAALVLAPGAPLTHPKPHWTVLRAQAAGVEVIGDIELFVRERRARAPDAPFVAITGTNGKSTTTALIAHLLRTAGREVALGGNIGVPILDLEPPSPERVHVIECSSFQIDLAPSLNPSVGLLLNVTPDHLDRHGTIEAYAAIKERLVAASDIALVGLDDEYCRAVVGRLKAAGRKVIAISQRPDPLADIYVEGHVVMASDAWADPSEAAPVIPANAGIQGTRRAAALDPRVRGDDESHGSAATLFDLALAPALRGEHNGQNAAFAVAAALALGAAQADIARGLASFPGLAHRMEQVGRDGRVLFVNDSKATNADASEKALKSFNDIFWILGGKPKEGGIEPLRPLFGRIAKAYLIGAASDAFARTLGAEVAHEFCGDLQTAVASAARDALASPAPEPVVLLSPACASYDQFANFEVRGDRFRELVYQRLRER